MSNNKAIICTDKKEHAELVKSYSNYRFNGDVPVTRLLSNPVRFFRWFLVTLKTKQIHNFFFQLFFISSQSKQTKKLFLKKRSRNDFDS